MDISNASAIWLLHLGEDSLFVLNAIKTDDNVYVWANLKSLHTDTA